jgi:hypothetical protein
MYGEHGGLMNREHGRSGVRGWHQADVLAGPLHFLPLYAHGSRARYGAVRALARARGWYRFLYGKYFDRWPALLRSRRDRLGKLSVVVRRLMSV